MLSASEQVALIRTIDSLVQIVKVLAILLDEPEISHLASDGPLRAKIIEAYDEALDRFQEAFHA